MMEHACGIKTHTKKEWIEKEQRHISEVVDEFPGFMEIFEKFKSKTGCLCSGHNKSRIANYREDTKTLGYDTIELSLPNLVRVAHSHTFFLIELRSMHTQIQYSGRDFNFCAFNHTNAKWRQVAELEAILQSVSGMCFEVQEDTPGSVSCSWFICCSVYVQYKLNSTYCIVDTEGGYKWHGNAKMINKKEEKKYCKND